MSQFTEEDEDFILMVYCSSTSINKILKCLSKALKRPSTVPRTLSISNNQKEQRKKEWKRVLPIFIAN